MHGPRRPAFANLDIEPAPGVDDMHPRVDSSYPTEIGIADWLDHEHVNHWPGGLSPERPGYSLLMFAALMIRANLTMSALRSAAVCSGLL